MAYCPWSNGNVEVVFRELLRAIRALLAEFQLIMRSYPEFLAIVQSALNKSPLQRLGGRCPRTAFTGLPLESPLRPIKSSSKQMAKSDSVTEARRRKVMKVLALQAYLNSMPKNVSKRARSKRRSSAEFHNRNTNVQPINLDVGDFVFRGLLQREVGRKPSLRWKGLLRVTKCRDEYIFEVENIANGNISGTHGRRIRFYSNKALEFSEEIRDYVSYQEGELISIKSFLEIRSVGDNTELQVLWRGFDKEEAE